MFFHKLKLKYSLKNATIYNSMHTAQQHNFIVTEGSYYDMGFQQGEKFKGEIQRVFKRILKMESISLVKPIFLPGFLFAKIFKKFGTNKVKKPIDIITPNQAYRILGLSEGSKTDLDTLYCVQALEVISNEVNFVMGCFSIALLREKFNGKKLVIGKNFDYIKGFTTDNIIRISKPKGKYSSIDLTYHSIAGAHDGMNEKGLVVVYNYGVTKEYTEARLPITLIVQDILENCATVDEAIALIRNFRYPNGAILTLADVKNNVASVEISPEHIGLRYPKDGFLVNTNFFQTPEMKQYDIPSDAYYSKKSPKAIRGTRIHESNEKRYYRSLDLLHGRSSVDMNLMKNILMDHDNKPRGDGDTICRHGEFFETQVSAMFFPEDRKVLVNIGNPCGGIYKEYSIQ